jgi:pantothenate kinase-related protein Tda10
MTMCLPRLVLQRHFVIMRSDGCRRDAPAVLAISGPIGSGKTTITTLLSQRIGWPHPAVLRLALSIHQRNPVSGMMCWCRTGA